MKALVLLSGGQDSTTSLFWAINQGYDCEALIFYYGQRHMIEIEAARRICGMAGIQWHYVDTDIFKQIGGDSALLNKSQNISEKHRTGNLPASFVPGRNIFFLTIAGMIAYREGIADIVIGVSQEDYSGYPDCRSNTINAMQRALNYGMDYPFELRTPVMFLSKKEEVELAKSLPGCMEALAFSHTCYEGQFPPCGKCPACVLRAKGFAEAGVEDPLIRRANEFV
jgi:7-cyano-7-deazaguanine synthase